MTHIFVSHSSKDAPLALRMVEQLEAAGHQCWISARDVAPGEHYPREIMEALTESRAVVLLLTENSNQSAHVYREIERTANARKPLITFRAQNLSQLAPELEYFLSTSQWLDASSGNADEHFARLVERVGEIDSGGLAWLTDKRSAGGRRRWWVPALAAALVATLMIGIIALADDDGPEPRSTDASGGTSTSPKTMASADVASASDVRWKCASPANKVVPTPNDCREVSPTEPFFEAAFPRLRPMGCTKVKPPFNDASGAKLIQYQCQFDGENGYTLSFALWNEVSSAKYHYGNAKGLGNFPPEDREARAFTFGSHTKGLLWDTEQKQSTDGRPYKATFLYSVDPTTSSSTIAGFSVSVVAATREGFHRGKAKVFTGQAITRNDWLRARPLA